MPNTGHTYPGTGENDVPVTATPAANWSTPGNIGASDASSAVITTSLGAPYILPYLRGSNYGFAIPSGEPIRGIEVILEFNTSNYSSYVDDEMKLAWGAAAVNVSPTDLALDTAQEVGGRTYGGPTEMWGTSLTDVEINTTDFGVIYKAGRAAGSSSRSLAVDSITINVYYGSDAAGGVQSRQYQSLLLDI